MRNGTGDAVHARRRGRRSGRQAAGAAADRGRYPLSRAVRHDRREPDADRRRARPCRPARGRGSRRAGAGARRRRRIRHQGSHPHRQAHEAGRRGRHPVGHALLQQADTRRPLPALQRDCRRGRPADRRLQRARPDRLQRRRRDARPPQRRAGHRRRQGSVGQHFADRARSAAPCRRTSSCCRETMR